jgi:hypothetical protein
MRFMLHGRSVAAPRGDARAPARPARIRRDLARALALGAGLALAAPIASADDQPSTLLLYGNESAAAADGPSALIFNPAAAGQHYPSEFALTLFDPRGSKQLYRGALAYNGFTFAAAGARDQTVMPGIGIATQNGATRLGAMATWIPRDQGGRDTDYRVGLLTSPSPALTLGAVANHLNRAELSTGRLEREYTVGAALKPLALARKTAGRYGWMVTLTGDVLFRDDRREWRMGAEVEPVAGVSLRGMYFFENRGFQLGVSLLSQRTGYHAQSAYTRGGVPSFATYSVSFHEGEDRTVLVPRGGRRFVGWTPAP